MKVTNKWWARLICIVVVSVFMGVLLWSLPDFGDFVDGAIVGLISVVAIHLANRWLPGMF